jgi:hypothetical protein
MTCRTPAARAAAAAERVCEQAALHGSFGRWDGEGSTLFKTNKLIVFRLVGFCCWVAASPSQLPVVVCYALQMPCLQVLQSGQTAFQVGC